MELLGNIMGAISVILTLVFGLFLSFKTRFFQFEGLKNVFKTGFSGLILKSKAGQNNSRAAMCTALASTIGTGNIVGISGAIALGGAGVVFWLVASSILAMIIKFVEIYTVVGAREFSDGEYKGGAMYAVKKQLKSAYMPLGIAFAFFIVLASFGTGNLIQMNTGAIAVKEIFANTPKFSDKTALLFCVVSAVFIGFLLLSGMGVVSKFCERLIPFTLVFYLAAAAFVIIVSYKNIGEVLVSIFKGAFSPKGVTGGAVASVFLVVKTGVVRGLVSNEAGMGSAPIAHSTASADGIKEGELGIAEVFIDTLVSVATAFIILLGNKNIAYGADTGLLSVFEAFENSFGGLSRIILSLFLILFGVSSVLGWGAFGGVCAEFLWGKNGSVVYKLIFSAVCVLGAVVSVDKIWIISEILNSLVLIPNIIIVYLLFNKIFIKK